MALEGEQEGDPRDGQDQETGRLSGREAVDEHAAPGTGMHQGSAANPDHPGAMAAPVVSAPLGMAQRKGRRSRSFPYGTGVFQGENLTYAILTQPSQGWVTNNGDGTFSFDPGLDFRDLKPDESRRISFSYQVSDGWSGAETASASLTVTGTADGTLAIEMASGNAPRRAEASWHAEPVDDGEPQAGPPPVPPELPAVEHAEALWGSTDPGIAENRRDSPTVAAADAEIGHVGSYDLEAAADAASGGEKDALGPGLPFSDGDSEYTDAAELVDGEPGGASAYAEMPPREPEPALTANSFEQTSGIGEEVPLADGADSVAAAAAIPAEGEAPSAPHPEGALLGESAAWAMDAIAPEAAPEEDQSAHDSDEPQGGPDPVGPGPAASGGGQRYTILAQPPEGQVTVTDGGEFEFMPGPDFPDLEVGELYQVSFTCESADADGGTSIVIASLTITGTSDAPGICDVSFRRAQGTDADQRKVPPHATEPDAGVRDLPDLVADGSPPDGEVGDAGPAARDSTAEPSAEDTAPPLPWPDPEAGAVASDLLVDPAAEAEAPGIARASEPDAAAPGGPSGSRQDDLPSWGAAAAIHSEAAVPPTWQAEVDGGPDAFSEDPAPGVEPAAGDLSTPYDDEGVPASAPDEERQIVPAAGDAAADMPTADGTSASHWHQHPEPEIAGDFGRDFEPNAEHTADDAAPADDAEISPILDPGSERQAEPATMDWDDGDQFSDDYRGAVAAEAVADFLPEPSNMATELRFEPELEPGGPPQDIAPEPIRARESTAAGMEPEPQAMGMDSVFGDAGPGDPPAQAAEDPHRGGQSIGDGVWDALQDGAAVTAEPAADDPAVVEPERAADDPEAVRVSDAEVEDPEAPVAVAQDPAQEPGLALVAAADEAEGTTELSDFALSNHTVVENCEAGTVVGQVLVAGAQEGSRFIFDLQNDAGGRFDVNPRTGNITVADGALLNHEAADSHDILVQVIAHSGVSCRKTLTIKVLPAGAGHTAGPMADSSPGLSEPADEPMSEAAGNGGAKDPAFPSGSGHETYPLDESEMGRLGDEVTGGNNVDTLHLDGVTGGPGFGGWSLELTEGEIVETNDDNVKLSKNSAGSVLLDGCPAKVAFQGVERIEW